MSDMLVRLLVGVVKGLVLGALVGFALAKAGLLVPPALLAYVAAAVTGVLVGLVAGKPIWAKDAKIEAGMKAVVGALLGAGLMFAARRWLTIELPAQLGDVLAKAVGTSVPAGSTVGGLGVTSLAAVAALLAGFYDADNTPSGESGEKASEPEKKAPESKKAEPAPKKAEPAPKKAEPAPKKAEPAPKKAAKKVEELSLEEELAADDRKHKLES